MRLLTCSKVGHPAQQTENKFVRIIENKKDNSFLFTDQVKKAKEGFKLKEKIQVQGHNSGNQKKIKSCISNVRKC